MNLHVLVYLRKVVFDMNFEEISQALEMSAKLFQRSTCSEEDNKERTFQNKIKLRSD